MLRRINILFICLIVGLFSTQVYSQSLGIKGQASGWMTVNPEQNYQTQLGVRYIPELSFETKISKKFTLDAELSISSYGAATFFPFDSAITSSNLKPYRAWIRLSSAQFELRAGLQKINFGSAVMLRPLMWFDTMDPRDPLQLTDGVYGLLGRYYFLNNANVWLWALYGNTNNKGWEFYPTANKKPEYGGRVQLPFFTGEIAGTYHRRKVAHNDGLIVGENRYAIDGKWDMGVGVWVEGSITEQDIAKEDMPFRRIINIGMDYTFGIGNGLNATTEFINFSGSESAFGDGVEGSLSTLSITYPVSIFDNISAIVYYDWNNKDWYRFINWQRTFDRWSLYFMGFWNPNKFQIYQNQEETSMFAGTGLQIMVVFNH